MEKKTFEHGDFHAQLMAGAATTPNGPWNGATGEACGHPHAGYRADPAWNTDASSAENRSPGRRSISVDGSPA